MCPLSICPINLYRITGKQNRSSQAEVSLSPQNATQFYSLFLCPSSCVSWTTPSPPTHFLFPGGGVDVYLPAPHCFSREIATHFFSFTEQKSTWHAFLNPSQIINSLRSLLYDLRACGVHCSVMHLSSVRSESAAGSSGRYDIVLQYRRNEQNLF